MGKKLGWYELHKDQLSDTLTIKIFSTKWRKDEDSEKIDAYYPDIALDLQESNDEWFVAEMSISNPSIKEFSEIAIELLKEFTKKDPNTIPGIIKELDKFLTHGIPDYILQI